MSRKNQNTTPGPWQAQYSAIRSAYSIASVSCARQVAWISGDSEAQRLGEAEANASLIAKTPELITTLAAIVETQKALGPDADPRTKAAASMSAKSPGPCAGSISSRPAT